MKYPKLKGGERMKFYKTLPEEQETIINIDYLKKQIRIYSSRKSVLERLYKKLGEPTKTHYLKKEITGAYWEIKFEDKKKISSALSRPLLIGNIK